MPIMAKGGFILVLLVETLLTASFGVCMWRCKQQWCPAVNFAKHENISAMYRFILECFLMWTCILFCCFFIILHCIWFGCLFVYVVIKEHTVYSHQSGKFEICCFFFLIPFLCLYLFLHMLLFRWTSQAHHRRGNNTCCWVMLISAHYIV